MAGFEITVLGNGGCHNSGLPYHSFLVNSDLLVEAPPDVMHSLLTTGADIRSIRKIFISHLHGDHYFGLPFLFINLWIALVENGATLQIIGPAGIGKSVKSLMAAAFGTEHPSVPWTETLQYVELDRSFRMEYGKTVLSVFPLEHIEPTWGLRVSDGSGVNLFSYFADTRWCEGVRAVLLERPRVVIADMNGGKAGVHMSVEEIEEKALSVTGEETLYYGSHLWAEFEDRDRVRCTRPGMKIQVE